MNAPKHWFTGVVEEAAGMDPYQAGRVRVRCFSYHNPDHVLLPTENLIWAHCLLPVSDGGIGDVGSFNIGLQAGDWVMGFFRDGDDMQDPVVLGGWSGSAGNSINYQDNLGYGDPYGAYQYHSGTNAFQQANSFTSRNGYAGGMAGLRGSMSVAMNGGSTPIQSSWHPATEPIVLSGNGIKDLVDLALREVGTPEQPYASNKGPVSKYWSAVGWAGWKSGQPYCAAFVSWVVEQSKILEDESKLPKTAGVSAMVAWAKRSPFMNVYSNPTSVKKGDLIRIQNWSHVGIAVTDSDPATGKYISVDGNGPAHNVAKRNRTLRGTLYAMRFNVKGNSQLPEPGIHSSTRPALPT